MSLFVVFLFGQLQLYLLLIQKFWRSFELEGDGLLKLITLSIKSLLVLLLGFT
jgi:hypothetical protein